MSAGVLSQISVGLESTWGTAVVPSASLAVKPGDGIQADTDVQFVESINARLAKNTSAFKGAVKYEGEYEFEFIPGTAGLLMKSLFGGLSSAAKSAPNGTVYDHTFTESATKPSLTVEQATSEIVRRYAGVIVTSMKLSCSVGEALMATFGMKGKSSASATQISASYETVRPFNFADLGPSGFSVGGQTYTPQSFELEFKNNHEMLHALGANDPAFNYARHSEVTGKFELYLNSTAAAEYTDYLAKTDNSLSITFTGDSIGSSSNYGLAISVPKATFKAANVPVSDEYNQVAVEFEAIYDTATSKQISAVLTNLTTSY